MSTTQQTLVLVGAIILAVLLGGFLGGWTFDGISRAAEGFG